LRKGAGALFGRLEKANSMAMDEPKAQPVAEGFRELAARLRKATSPQATDATDLIRSDRDRDHKGAA
jgi:hypothetical protein